jgi:hypothetical protein
MRWDRKDKTKLGMAAIVVAVFVVCIVKYSAAYKDSAEWITITVSDKEIRTHTDDEGGSTTYYVVRTRYGEQFNCRGQGWNGAKPLYYSLRVDQRYEVLVAGLGYLDRDILENKGLVPFDLTKPEK